MGIKIKKINLFTRSKKMDCENYRMPKSTETVSNSTMKQAEVVCIYFSAHWCPPCRGFTPVLSKFYDEVNKDGKKMEIIFVSCDQDEKQFQEYHDSMSSSLLHGLLTDKPAVELWASRASQ